MADAVRDAVQSDMFRAAYADVFDGDERWHSLEVPTGRRYAWDDISTYVHRPPFFDGMPADPAPLTDVLGARCLAMLGDSVTTDHISPAGSIKADGPAGRWLLEHGVEPADFNSYGARRGNHEVMVRGTFANIRLRNRLAPGTEGGVTRHLPSGEELSIYDASMRYAAEGVPLVILAGKEYGSGSSRDWAAKGTALLGVRAVLAESFERIHRSNLIGMGVLPLQFDAGESVGVARPRGHGVVRRRRAGRPGRGRALPHRSPSAPTAASSGRCSHRHPEGSRLLPPRRHPAVRAPPARRGRTTQGSVERCDAGEQVGLGQRGVDEARGEDEVFLRVDALGDIVGQPEPEALGGVDLRGVRDQRRLADRVEPGQVDGGGDALIGRRSLEPTLVEGRLEAQLDELLVHRHDPGPREARVVELLRLPRLTRLGVLRGVTRLERGDRDGVHLEVVGVRVALLIVAVGEDHVGAFGPDDRPQAYRRPRRSGVEETVGSAFSSVSGMPESR